MVNKSRPRFYGMRAFYTLGDTVHAAAHLSGKDPQFKLAKNFIRLLLLVGRIPGVPVAFREANAAEQHLSRFYSCIRFHRKLYKCNRSHHLIVLVKERQMLTPLMFSMHREGNRLEIMDVSKVRAIRFLIWLGLQIQEATCLPTSFASIWNEVVIPCCTRDAVVVEEPTVRSRPWSTQRDDCASNTIVTFLGK